MRVSYQWLCELAGVQEVSPERVAHVLTMAGWNVESLTLIDLSEIRVGRIISLEPHPTSRNPLWVYQVDLGNETRQIIAGVYLRHAFDGDDAYFSGSAHSTPAMRMPACVL